MKLPHPGIRFLAVLACVVAVTRSSQAADILGDLRCWRPLRLQVEGPESSETADANPFLDIRLLVTFSCGDAHFLVPGYFAADGNAGETGAARGNIWRAHFVPDRAGAWTYRVSLRTGENIAISDEPDAGSPAQGDGQRGTFVVAPAPDARGMLRYVGKRYLQDSARGTYFLKIGADSPENFLAYVDFDGDYVKSKNVGRRREGEAPLAPRHRYEPHVQDWNRGDPTWRDGRGKGIIGALNYLASKGVNSVYFLTMNVAGDGNDVWPYVSHDERYRFDCSKLDQWEVVFSHMDRLGQMLHVVLTETENESLFESEEGTDFALARKLYYRELVARFAHHSGLVWNLGEENGWDDRDQPRGGDAARANSHEQRKRFASFLRRLDPYHHPVVVHTLPGRYDEIYRPLLGYPALEGPSLQIAQARDIHAETKKWIDLSEASGRPWFVCLDELGPAGEGVKPDADDPEHNQVRHRALWGNLMAGGAGVEWYFGYKFANNDLNCEDFRSRENMWNQSRVAAEFFRRYLPFDEMRHGDEYVSNARAYCLTKPGSVYAVYLPPGEGTDIWLPKAEYSVRWYNPRVGGTLKIGPVARIRGPGYHPLGDPPDEPNQDWVVLLRRDGSPPAAVGPPE